MSKRDRDGVRYQRRWDDRQPQAEPVVPELTAERLQGAVYAALKDTRCNLDWPEAGTVTRAILAALREGPDDPAEEAMRGSRPFALGGDVGKMLVKYGGRIRFYGITVHHWGFGFIRWTDRRLLDRGPSLEDVSTSSVDE